VIKIPHTEFKFTFSRSSGAGGQNVNKVNSKASMTWEMEVSKSLSSFVKIRFTEKYKRYIIDSNVVIHSQKYRSQAQNIDDCIAKLHELIADVEFPQKARRKTKPTRGSNTRRLDKKKKDSLNKKLRRQKF
jgi:ribosome-associated protein